MALPYDLQVKTDEDNEPYTLLSIHPNKGVALILTGVNMDGVDIISQVKIDTIKPYLRPMSSITEEERKIFAKLLFSDLSGVNEDFYKSIDYLNSIHVDYRGLIEKGLAIEVTHKNNPYNITEE